MGEMGSLEFFQYFGTSAELIRPAVREEIGGQTYIYTHVCLLSDFNSIDQLYGPALHGLIMSRKEMFELKEDSVTTINPHFHQRAPSEKTSDG